MAERFDFTTNRWTHDDPTASKTLSELAAPTTPPRPGAWTGPSAKSKPLARVLLGTMALVAIAAVASVILGYGIAFVVLTWVGIVLFLAYAFVTEERVRPEDLALLEDPGDREVCPVSLRVMVDGRTVGKDRGVAWFEDGRLLYTGSRTSFAFGGEDLLPKSEWKADYDLVRALGTLLPLRVARRCVIHVLPLSGKGREFSTRVDAFSESLKDFLRHPRQGGAGPRQWPPLEP